MIDVGYAGVIGADRMVDGDQLYGEGFSTDVERGDTYGPLNYLAYVPFEQALPWSGSWDDLPAAHGAAISFDLLVVGGLLLLGVRLRPGRDGRLLGLALAYAWAAFPYTAFALETNSNDSLVALACVLAMLALTISPARTRLGAVAAASPSGAGAASKFVPLALAPLFAVYPARAARAPGRVRARPGCRARRGHASRSCPTAGCARCTTERSATRCRAHRRSASGARRRSSGCTPWSSWRPGAWRWPWRSCRAQRGPRQMAALGAAVLIALQLAATHWFYLYVVWFLPFLLVTSLGAYRERERAERPAEPAREPEAVVA